MLDLNRTKNFLNLGCF